MQNYAGKIYVHSDSWRVVEILAILSTDFVPKISIPTLRGMNMERNQYGYDVHI